MTSIERRWQEISDLGKFLLIFPLAVLLLVIASVFLKGAVVGLIFVAGLIWFASQT